MCRRTSCNVKKKEVEKEEEEKKSEQKQEAEVSEGKQAKDSARKRNKLFYIVKMFALIWATLLFTAMEDVTSIAWYKCQPSGECNKQIFNSSDNSTTDSEIRGRVSLLEPDLKKKNCSIIINNLTTSDAGSYQVSAEGVKDGCTYVSKANITVEVINPILKIPPLIEEYNVTLNCSAPGFCSGSKPQITWLVREAGKEENLAIIDSNTEFMINMTNSHTSTLNFKVSAKHHGTRVTCRVIPGNTMTEKTLNVSFSPRIRNGSVCKNHSDVLTCVCVSEGSPLPTITWPLLKNVPKYTVLTIVSELSVISNMTVSFKKLSDVTVECVSKNDVDTIKENLTIQEVSKTNPNKNIFKALLKLFEEHLLYVLLVFGVGYLIGSLLSTFIVCLAMKCHRNKKKQSYSTEELELVTTETVRKDCDDNILHEQDNGILDLQHDGTLDFPDDGIQNQVAAECGEEPAGDLIGSDMSPRETVYSDIDFSALKEKNPADAKEKENTTETEYAEIKRGEMKEAQENEEMDCEMLDGNDEMEVMIEHQDEEKQGMVAEEVIGENEPLYSNTNEVMDEN